MFLSSLAEKLGCNIAQLNEKVSKLLTDNTDLISQLGAVHKEVFKQLVFTTQEGSISYQACEL